MTPEWMETREIARLLGLSRQAVQGWRSELSKHAVRTTVGRGGPRVEYRIEALPADKRARVREALRLRPPLAGSAQGESLRDPSSGAATVTTDSSRAGSGAPSGCASPASGPKEPGRLQEPQGGDSPKQDPQSLACGTAALAPSFALQASAGELSSPRALEGSPSTALGVIAKQSPLFEQTEIQRLLEHSQGRTVSAKDVEEALRKQQIVLPLSDKLDPRPEGYWTSWLGSFMPNGKDVVRNKTDAVAQRAWKYDVSAGAVWDWLRRFEAGGIAALLRKERGDANTWPSLKAAGLDRLKVIAELQAHRYNARATAHSLQQAGTPVSYDVLKRIARGVPQAVKDFYRLGPTALRDKHVTFITRRWEDYEPNQMWESDHFQFDPLTQRWPNPNPIFPWGTVVLDFATGYPISWWPSFQPHSGTIVAAYARAFARHGLPQSVGYDFGKDYRGKVVTNFMLRIGDAFRVKFPQDVFQSRLPSLRIHDFTKRKPQVKPCERSFGTIHKRFCAMFDSYRGPSTAKRSEWVNLMLAEHKNNPAASTLIHVIDLFRAFDYWFFREYPYMETRGRKNKGRCPADLYRNSDRWLKPEELDWLRLTRETRIVRRSAVTLTVGGEERRFEHPELLGHNTHEATVRHNFNLAECPDLDVVAVECCGQRYEARWLAAPYCQEEVQERLRIQTTQKNSVAFLAGFLNHLKAGDRPADRFAQKALAAGTDHPALNPARGEVEAQAEPRPATPFISDRFAMVKKVFSKGRK